MKKILSILLVGVLLLSGVGAAVSVFTQHNKVSLEVDLSFSEPILTDQNNFLSVEITEAPSSATSPGNPMLPMYTKLFSFPFGTIIRDVSFTTASEQTIPLTKQILLKAEPTPVSRGSDASSNYQYSKNEDVYS